MPVKECPLCGTEMQIKITESVVYVPGASQTSTRQLREWVCPECDHFEEAEEEGRSGGGPHD
jgi:YgiT-type zinc finger domain-containing protein